VDELISRLSDQFGKELPGWNSHQKMMNYKRPKPDNIRLIDPDAKESAVLALLYPYDDDIYTVLMQRHVYEGTHSGQISFPGGKREISDRDLRETALREANEELSIDENKVNIIGELTQVYIPPSRYLVSPFLGYVTERPDFIPEPSEVSAIIEVPVSQFLDPGRLKEKYHFIPTLNSDIKIRYFDIDEKVVWGATAMMLSEISEILRKTDLF
jgi:8-oxo-dGTP pyrophosphatase MutT (NUDIX family)